MTHQNISRFEEDIRNRTKEWCAVFSENGEKILEKESIFEDSHEVCKFNDSEFEKMKNQILTHNHPSRSPFSTEDITLAVDAQLSELRVVTAKGTFSLKRNSNCWPEKTWIFVEFEKIENNCKPGLEQKFRDSAIHEGLDYSDHDWYIKNLIWKKISEPLELQYQYEPYKLSI
jgi:hypothetical protein